GRLSFGLVLPDLTEDILGSYSGAGIAVMANLGAQFVGLFCVIALSRRFDAATLVKAGLVGTIAGMAVVNVATSYAVLVAGMAAAGFFAAAVWTPGAAVIARSVPESRRGFSLGVATAGAGIGIIVSGRLAVLTDRIEGPGSWRVLWAIQLGISVVVMVLTLLLVRTEPLVVRRDTTPSTRTALRGLPAVGPLLVGFAAFGVVFSVFASYLVAMLEDDAAFTGPHAATAYSVFGLTSIGGGILLGRASDTIGRRLTLMGCAATMGLCGLVVLAHAEPWVTAASAVCGLAMTGVGATTAAYVGDNLSAGEMAAVYSAVSASIGAAQFIGPPVGGVLADVTGSFTTTFVLVAAFGLAAAGSFSRLPRDRRVRTASR
ncbi:MAG: nitrate/nitrite transporter, partial [Acidimicrobiia bacterium]